MEWKVAREMKLISNPGNRDGYSVVEACVSIFVAGTLLLSVLGLVKGTINYSKKIYEIVNSNIENQNKYNLEWSNER